MQSGTVGDEVPSAFIKRCACFHGYAEWWAQISCWAYFRVRCCMFAGGATYGFWMWCCCNRHPYQEHVSRMDSQAHLRSLLIGSCGSLVVPLCFAIDSAQAGGEAPLAFVCVGNCITQCIQRDARTKDDQLATCGARRRS